jgi:hypothetical protein
MQEVLPVSDQKILEALEHFSKAFALLTLAGMPETQGTVSFIPAAFDAADAAKYIGIGRTKLFEYRDARRIRTHEVGGRPKYYRKDLDRLLAEIEKESNVVNHPPS